MLKRESSNLEYKEAISNTFLKTVSAYANFGQGIIYFGMTDHGDVVGLDGDLKQICMDLENKINDSIKPTPSYHLEINEDRTITLTVDEGDYKPYMYKNKAYRRADSATVEVDRLELKRLVLEGSNLNYEDLAAEHQDLRFMVLAEALIEKLNISNFDMDILKTLDLYTDKRGFNKAAEILADENNYSGIDIIQFGKNINEILYRETIENVSAIQQFEKTLLEYRKHYQHEVIEDALRREVERIPENAFREALANSIVHRVWDTRTPIRISFYNNKIEITSPGGLPTGVSEEEYLNDQISVLRNPILGNVFFRLRYIERFGTGIKRINQAYHDSITKPEYNVYAHSITVVLPVFSKDVERLGIDAQDIFLLLREEGELPRTEIESKLGLNKDRVIRLLNQLIEQNIIRKTGRGRGTKYELR